MRNEEFIKDEDKEKYDEHLSQLNDLKNQQELYLNLCDDFDLMIQLFNITILPYLKIFGEPRSTNHMISFESPAILNSFVRRTAIPSEDFEIVFSAERIGANIFITDDKKLITCSKSLGLNSFLSPAAFCLSDEYIEKKKQWKENIMFAKLE